MKPIILLLTCANKKEANKISDSLLEKRLVVCIKKTQVSSKYLWKRKIEKNKEILLIMESLEENFGEIEKEIKKLHSYETFVLLALPVIKSSYGAKDWLKD